MTQHKRKLFGTDGVRGEANRFPMTAQTALQLGISAGRLFTTSERPHSVVIGKDTRLSGYMIEYAMVAGFTAVGMNVILLGPLPTPAISMLTRSMRADLGVMISASHNPYQDNGIKFFGPDGYKLSDEREFEIESLLSGNMDHLLAPSGQIGQVVRLDDALGRYIEYTKNTLPKGAHFDGLKIVVDCANGAAYKTAPVVFRELGATVVTAGTSPTGRNINLGCGATDTYFMREEVVKHNADIGVSFDGDADRLIVSDEKGNLIDGDQLLALIGTRWHAAKTLKKKTLVATVQSNMALENYLKAQDIHLVRTKVGDRYVVEEMVKKGYNLGGEQSGHLILGDLSTTGDGLVAALQICHYLSDSGQLASELLNVFKPYPQKMENIVIKDKEKVEKILNAASVKKALAEQEKKLGDAGRVFLRASGTEPLIRVTAEAENPDLMKDVLQKMTAEIKSQI